MIKLHAFTDESGAFGYRFDKPNVSTHFIISAIMIEEENLDTIAKQLERIREQYFPKGEIKSSRVKDHKRRLKIINELQPLPFKIFSLVVDKRKLTSYKGLQHKKSFYKFINNIIHKELRRTFENITIHADEIGGSEYMKSFSEYVYKKQDPPELFKESKFLFENSKMDVRIQLADFIAGTISFFYEPSKQQEHTPNYRKLLDSKIIQIKEYPNSFKDYNVDSSNLAENYNLEVAGTCFRQASVILERKRSCSEIVEKQQFLVLDYLLFRFMNNDLRKYIPTKELKSHLAYNGYEIANNRLFRKNIIGKLRDEGVIISSSSKGYKIPAKESELFDFVNHSLSMIMPMLKRIKKCCDSIKLGTIGKLDILQKEEYTELRKYFEICQKKDS